MRYVLGALLMLSGIGAITPAHAQLAVDKLWVDFDPGTADSADVVIRNESADRYYITVTPSEITDPGTEKEQRVAVTDPEKLGLLVTPNRMVIDPGGLRSIRIVSLNGLLTADRVYRVKIAPQVGDIQAPDPGAANRGMTIKVLAAYDLLVTVRPKGAKPQLVVTRSPAEILIRNTGNSNALLFDGQACSSAGAAAEVATACEKIGAKRLYAGTEWKIPIKSADSQLKFKERDAASLTPKDVVF